MNTKPIYEIITDYLDTIEFAEGEIVSLGKDFHLPQEDNGQVMFADGAMDGIAIYHMGVLELTEDDKSEIEKMLRLAGANDYEQADETLVKLCERVRTIAFLDEMQRYIINNTEDLDANNIYGYAAHLMMESSVVECVKVGMMLMELFEQNDAVKKVMRTLGLSDEFTLYTVFNMRRWEDCNTEIMNLAKSVNGWGRIHAVHYIEPETDEIKKWLLKDGVSNYVVPSYSGLECYRKAEVGDIIERESITYEELEGVLAIMDAMLDEGPAQGISALEEPEETIAKVLKQARGHLSLKTREADVVNNLYIWQKENGEEENQDIKVLVDSIFADVGTRENIMRNVEKGQYINLADSVGLPYKETLFSIIEKDFDSSYMKSIWLMKDDNYVEKTLDLFREKMNLEDVLATEDSTSHKLTLIVQELRSKVGVGEDFVEAALKSSITRNRNIALNVLGAWVNSSVQPLINVSPKLYEILKEIAISEEDETLRQRMDEILKK